MSILLRHKIHARRTVRELPWGDYSPVLHGKSFKIDEAEVELAWDR